MSICSTLQSFARQREKAYTITKNMTGKRAKAIFRIIQVTEYFKGKKEEWRAVGQLKEELAIILPDENSRYQKMRETILKLLKQ